MMHRILRHWESRTEEEEVAYCRARLPLNFRLRGIVLIHRMHPFKLAFAHAHRIVAELDLIWRKIGAASLGND
jgi:hypothetical protein